MDAFSVLIFNMLMKVLKKMKLSLSKSTIEKLSNADTSTIYQFLTSLKHAVDEFECKKQRKLEKNQHFPVYMIVDNDMIQVSGKC